MSDREAHRFDHLSDGHLADKAAYGDSGAFVALADRFHDEVWTVAALASGDEATATRATARAFTRTLAGVAAGISDPDACVERALVAAAFELAVTARIDGEPDLVAALPAVLAALDPATRVALWLGEARGWDRADAVEAVSHGVDEPPADAVPGDAPEAVRAIALTTPAGLATATADAWHEWQGIGLTIPERHPLTTVLSRLDAPLGRMGDAIGRAGARAADRTRATRATRRRAKAAAAPAPATPPPPTHLPIEAGSEAAPVEPAPVVGELDLHTVPVATTPTATSGTTAATSAAALEEAADIFSGPRTFDVPERRTRPRAGNLITAGATPTRTRILAALAAGILTASAMGSLLSASPTDIPGSSGGDQVAAGSPTPDAQGEGALLDDSDLVPAAAVSDEAATAEAPTTTVATPTGAVPTASRTGGRTGSTSSGGSSGGSQGGGSTAGSGGASGSGGSAVSPGAGGGNGGGGSTPSAPTPTQPPATTQPAPPTTTPPPTTQPAPPTTTPPPTTQPPGPVCGLLPVLCPGGGLIP